MNEELIELYLEGFQKDYYQNCNRGRMKPYTPPSWHHKVFDLEEALANNDFIDWSRKDTEEFQEAAKRWRKIKLSKLYKVL